MEHAVVKFDGDEFDELVHGGCPEMGDLKFVFKDDATTSGNPAVVIAFTAVVDGKPAKVQAVTTLNVFLSAARAANGRYGP